MTVDWVLIPKINARMYDIMEKPKKKLIIARNVRDLSGTSLRFFQSMYPKQRDTVIFMVFMNMNKGDTIIVKGPIDVGVVNN